MLGSVIACVTSSCCYSSSSLDEFLDMPSVLRTKSSVLLLLVYVRLILVYIPVSGVDFSFLGILNLLSCLGALSPTISAVSEDVHPCGSRLILQAGGMLIWCGFGH